MPIYIRKRYPQLEDAALESSYFFLIGTAIVDASNASAIRLKAELFADLRK